MSLSSMRLALRLARRDARRAKGRSVLVVILLGLPVMAVAGAASLMDSFELSEAERVERQLGGADALMSWDYDVPVEQWPFDQYAYPVDYDAEVEEVEHTREDLEAVLPEGSRAIDVTLSQTQTPTEYGGQALDVWGLDLSDPIAEGVYPVLEGEAPGDGETALSQAAADKLGLGVGDEVELSDLDGGKFEISAIVEDPASLKGQFAVVPPEVAGGELDHWLVDTPEPLLWEDVRELNEVGVGALSQAVAENPPPESEYNASAGPASQEDMMIIGMGILLVAMVILQIVLLAGPAFAISAKRRTREFALLAVNGATPAQVRRTVLAGGVVLGVISTLVSLTAGFAIAAAATPLAENIVGQRAGDFSFFPAVTLPAALLALCTGLLAALTPAFIAGRQNVVDGLNGRRGTTRSKKRWVIVGACLIAAGVALGTFGIVNGSPTMLAVGVVLVELGLVLCTPALVGLISRAGKFLPLTPRIALRDAGRNRASAAPTISAVMGVVAAGVAITMFGMATEERDNSMTSGQPPAGTVSADISTMSDMSEDESEALDPEEEKRILDNTMTEVEELVREHLPATEAHVLPSMMCETENPDEDYCEARVVPPEDGPCPYQGKQDLTEAEQADALANPNCDERATHSGSSSLSYGAYVVDSPALKALTGASDADAAAAARVLEQGGVVVSDPDMVVDGQATMEVETLSYDEETGNEERVGEESFTLPAHALTTGNAGPEQTLLSQEAADALGYVRYSTVMLFETSRMPTQDEQEVLQETLINAGLAMDYSASGASGGPVDSSESVMVNVEVVEEQSSEVQTVLLLLGVVSGLLALGATAVATALAAAESRRDLGTLAAIGASPTMRRKLSLFQAGTISLLGAGLGVLAGVGACAAAIAAFNTTLSGLYPIQELYPLSMPWLNIVLALAVVPLVAMLGAGLLTRSRLPSERRAG